MVRSGCLAVLLALFLTGLTTAQPAAEDKVDLVRETTALIAAYPKMLREPILTLCQHPGAVAKLAKLGPKGPFEPAVAGEPKPVQDAVRVLSKYPEVFKALDADAAGIAAVGKAYTADKAKVLAEIDREAATESKATDEWSKRIGQDGEAIEQLTAALKAYQQQLGAGASADDAAAEAGVSATGDTLNINNLPSPGFVNYVMSNADVYPGLANTMVSQWLNTSNSYAYDRYFHNWWGRYQNHFHDEHFLRGDEQRADRLADVARYDRKYAKDDKRWDKFNEHRKEYAHLGKIEPPPKDHRLEPGRKPHIKGGSEHKPRRRPEAGRHPTVRRSHASEHHHVHHAAASHHHTASHRRR
ncbi:MAG: hypothetical protein JNM56_23810 [Planctomycetia bacterium]|nr:hypothetical protein [Planctomycetia bacterium]